LESEVEVVQWWHEHRSDFPRRYRMANDYLAIPASSVPSERANSEARETFYDLERLHQATFKAEMCVRSWLEIFQRMEIQTPCDYADAYNKLVQENSINLRDLAEDDEIVSYMLEDDHGRSYVDE
jgi:hAT family C-terminal dimerisation region